MNSTNRLRELREAQGWSEQQLADRLAPQPSGKHLTPGTVRRWESNAYPLPLRRAAELSDLFGVSVTDLLGWDDNGNEGNGENGAERVA